MPDFVFYYLICDSSVYSQKNLEFDVRFEVVKACVVHQTDGVAVLPSTVCESVLKCSEAIEIYSTGMKNQIFDLKPTILHSRLDTTA